MAKDIKTLEQHIEADGYEPVEYPPEAVKNAMGKLYRPVYRELFRVVNGEQEVYDSRVEYRPVIFTGRSDEAVQADKDVARDKRLDCYDPDYGWIVEGYKLAKDRDVMSIMAEVRS